MMKIKHILVIMDPTIDQQPALSKAIALAKVFDASIELFLVVYHSGLTPKWFNQEHPREQIIANYLNTKQRWLDTYLADVAKEQLLVTSEVRWHKPLYAEILRKIDECHADLVIKSTHQHPSMNKILFTPNDWQLLKSCPAPLLLAKASTPENYTNVMAAVDLDTSVNKEEKSLDSIILDTTVMIAEYLNASAHVIHSYDPMGHELWQGGDIGVFGYDIASFDSMLTQEQLLEFHEKEFSRLIDHYAFDEQHSHLVQGLVQYNLQEAVDQHQIDLLVMGVRSHSGFISNTAEKILDEINCDILAVKSLPQT